MIKDILGERRTLLDDLEKRKPVLAQLGGCPSRAYLYARNSHPNPLVADHLLAKARAARTKNAAVAHGLAVAAYEAALRVTGPLSGDLQALALAEQANALRIMGRWPEASNTFSGAWEHAQEGTGDPLVLAEIYVLRASLHRQRCHTRDALTDIFAAIGIFHRVDERRAIIRALSLASLVAEDADDPEAACDLLLMAWRLAETEPLSIAARCGLIHNLLHAQLGRGYTEEVISLYEQVVGLYRAAGCEALEARGKWVYGRALRDSGHPERALRELGLARVVLEREGRHAEVALVWLDEALTALKSRQFHTAAAICRKIEPVYRLLGLRREQLATVATSLEAEEGSSAAKLVALVAAARRRRS